MYIYYCVCCTVVVKTKDKSLLYSGRWQFNFQYTEYFKKVSVSVLHQCLISVLRAEHFSLMLASSFNTAWFLMSSSRSVGFTASKNQALYRATLCISSVFAVDQWVCLSRLCIVSRRLKISSNFFLDLVAPSFLFFHCKCRYPIPREIPRGGVQNCILGTKSL